MPNYSDIDTFLFGVALVFSVKNIEDIKKRVD